MLILCIGPDTFRAMAKARDLEKAFREKHDKGGASIERLSTGKDGIDELIERANTVSLFSPRRFLRVSNLVSECPKAKQASVVQALTKEPENVVVVSVEEEPPTETAMKAFKDIPKIIKYEYPKQTGAAFRQAVLACATELGLAPSPALDRLAQNLDGDTWAVWNELLKWKAGGVSAVESASYSPSVYEYADHYLQELPSRFHFLGDDDALEGSLSAFVSQARSSLRVRDNATEGMHPFVVKKMSQARSKNPERHLGRALAALISQRAGFEDETEAALLF